VEEEAEDSEPETLGVRKRDLADFALVKGTEPEGRVMALDMARLRRGGEVSVEYPSESDGLERCLVEVRDRELR
jgi:hypothetical protein